MKGIQEMGAKKRARVALVGGMTALALSMALCVIIERFIPELLGQFPVFPSNVATSAQPDAKAKSPFAN